VFLLGTSQKNTVNTFVLATRSKKQRKYRGFRLPRRKKHRYLQCFFAPRVSKKRRNTTYLTIFGHNEIEKKIPTPIEGEGGGGAKPTCRIPLFLLGTPGIVIQLLKWNFKVTFLDKLWALVRKYLRLAPEELSASMMMATQFLEGCHPYTCAASV